MNAWPPKAHPNVIVLRGDRSSFLLLLLGECSLSSSGAGGNLEEWIPGGRFSCLGDQLGRGRLVLRS
jgi:hypothetical protein